MIYLNNFPDNIPENFSIYLIALIIADYSFFDLNLAQIMVVASIEISWGQI